MTTPPSSPSTSVRIDAATRAQLEVLRKRLLDQSIEASDIELRPRGVTLGLVVTLGLEALEEKLDESPGKLESKRFPAPQATIGVIARASNPSEPQNDTQIIPKNIPSSKPTESGKKTGDE